MLNATSSTWCTVYLEEHSFSFFTNESDCNVLHCAAVVGLDALQSQEGSELLRLWSKNTGRSFSQASVPSSCLLRVLPAQGEQMKMQLVKYRVADHNEYIFS